MSSLIYILSYDYGDFIKTLGVFSSEEELIKYIKNKLITELINHINKTIKDIYEEYNEKNKVEFNESWTYQTSFVYNVNWLFNYLKTNKDREENINKEYSIVNRHEIEYWMYHFNEINTLLSEDINLNKIKNLVTNKEINNIYDLNDFPDLKQEIKKILNNKDILEYYERQKCKIREYTKKR